MTKDVLHTIQENQAGFSKGQKRIAAYILSDYDKAAFMTASRLGCLVGVSEIGRASCRERVSINV